VDLALHPRELLRDAAEARRVLREREVRLHPVARDLEAGARDADRHDRDHGARGVEGLHGGLEAVLALVEVGGLAAEEVVDVDAAVLEDLLGRLASSLNGKRFS